MTRSIKSVYKRVMTELSAQATDLDAGERLDRFLASQFDSLSRSRVKSLIKDGAVSKVVSGKRQVVTDPNRSVVVGDMYTLNLPEPVPALPEPENIPLDVLFEDDDLVLVNKPAGMAVHPAPGSWAGTLVNALLYHCKGGLPGIGGVERPGIVHRIDKDTTGVIVVAKTEPAHKALSSRFASHDIERSYLALIRGAPRPRRGTLTGAIARSKTDRKKMAVTEAGDGKEAVTHYQVLETFGRLSKTDPSPAAALIKCNLETGRTHQIRVHMAHFGHSLIGDPVYGRHRGIKAFGNGPEFDAGTEAARRLTRQALHAATLAFPHPISGDEVSVSAPLPGDFYSVLNALRQLPGD